MSTPSPDLNSAGGISIDLRDAIAAAVESGDGDESCGEEDDGPAIVGEESEDSSNDDEGALFDDDDTAPPPQQTVAPVAAWPVSRAKSESPAAADLRARS
jgi:hypothetical protein